MTPREPTVVIVGAGPAGLAAAHALVERGVRDILVIDRDDTPGGLPRFCHHPGFGWEYTHRLETGPRFAGRMLARLDGAAVTIKPRTTALALRPGPMLDVLDIETGQSHLRPRAVILATGIRERPRSARLVPGRRPERGVLTTGQLQQLVARGVPSGGRRAVVVGTEHVAFSVLLTARRAGLTVVAMVEPETRVMSYAAAGWAARFLGVPIHLASAIEDIEGESRVAAIVLRGPRGLHRIACDTVVFSGDFIPDAALLPASGLAIDARTHGPVIDQFGRTSGTGIFAAGNLLRAVESSGWAAIEGARVGASAAAFLGGALAWRDDVAAIVAGDGLAYAMPQRWSTAGGGAPEPLSICLAASRDTASACLRLSVDGVARWTGTRRSFLRKRRITLPGDALAGIAGAQVVDIRVEQD